MGGPNKHFEVVPNTCTTCCNIKKDRQRKYVEHNNEARLRNYGCIGKTISTTYSECVCSLRYQACKVLALCYVVICGLSGSATFFRIILKRYDFSGKYD